MLKLIACCLLLAGVAVGQDKPAKRPGLEAQLTSLAVTKETYSRLTAAVKLTNNSPAYVFVLLFGPPHAVDDAGGNFQYEGNAVTGIAYCLGREGPRDPRSCMKPNDEQFFFPLDTYTEIAPGQSASFNIALRDGESRGSRYNLTQQIAYRLVKAESIEQDQSVPPERKLRALHFGSLNFSQVEAPPKEAVTSTVTFDMSSVK